MTYQSTKRRQTTQIKRIIRLLHALHVAAIHFFRKAGFPGYTLNIISRRAKWKQNVQIAALHLKEILETITDHRGLVDQCFAL
jgi:hypothetical protein